MKITIELPEELYMNAKEGNLAGDQVVVDAIRHGVVVKDPDEVDPIIRAHDIDGRPHNTEVR